MCYLRLNQTAELTLDTANAAHGQILEDDTYALRLDTSSFFLIAVTPKHSLEIKRFFGTSFLVDGLFNIGGGTLATLAGLCAAQLARS